MILKIKSKKKFIFILLFVLIFGINHNVFAQDNPSVLYVPLIGITSVPKPLALPNGPGNITYNYAVKNFLAEVPLTNIKVVDNMCSPIKFVEGDDNGDSKLGFNETWRYTCATKLAKTTNSSATVTGSANNIEATHTAYAAVVVGSSNPPPLVSIINITKVANPLSLPIEGGKITFSYKVSNPGVVPLSRVMVTDNKCSAMSGKLGDTNGNNLLDIQEVWIYTCTASLKETTTNTVNVTAFANGLKAVGSATITVNVDNPNAESAPLFDLAASSDAGVISNSKIIIWAILSGVLMMLMIFYAFIWKSRFARAQNKTRLFRKGKKR